jgi:hypothetical protein
MSEGLSSWPVLQPRSIAPCWTSRERWGTWYEYTPTDERWANANAMPRTPAQTKKNETQTQRAGLRLPVKPAIVAAAAIAGRPLPPAIACPEGLSINVIPKGDYLPGNGSG